MGQPAPPVHHLEKRIDRQVEARQSLVAESLGNWVRLTPPPACLFAPSASLMDARKEIGRACLHRRASIHEPDGSAL